MKKRILLIAVFALLLCLSCTLFVGCGKEKLKTVELTKDNYMDYLSLSASILGTGGTGLESVEGAVAGPKRFWATDPSVSVTAALKGSEWVLDENITLSVNVKYCSTASLYAYTEYPFPNSGVFGLYLDPLSGVVKIQTGSITIPKSNAGSATSPISSGTIRLDDFIGNSHSNKYTYLVILELEVTEISGSIQVPCVHTWDSGTVVTNPTCEKQGLKKLTCTECEAEKTVKLEKLTHNLPQTPSSVTPATCTSSGTETYVCTLCNKNVSKTLEALGHAYPDGSATVIAPTCTEAGSSTDTCTRCQKSVTETLSALGHAFTTYLPTPATCTADAYQTAKCDRCEETDTKVEAGSAPGHTYGEDNKCIRCQTLNPDLKVTSLEITNESLMLEAGAATQISFKVYPENAVYDKVSYRIYQTNTCEATLSESGLLQAAKVGRVTVAVTIDNEITTRATFYVPQMITTAEELFNIRNDLGGVYMLANDIDLSGYSKWTPIGNATKNASGNYDYTNAFKGRFDGGGYTVTGLNLVLSDTTCSSLLTVGLFGSLSREGQVSNLILKDVSVTGTASTTDYVGALVGFNPGSVENCQVFGNFSFTGGTYIGGAVGENIGSLKNIQSEMSIAFTTTVPCFVGGVTGRSNGGQIDKVTAKGSITVNSGSAAAYVGGVAGQLADKLEQASADVEVTVLTSSSSTATLYSGILAGEVAHPLKGITASGSLTVTGASSLYVGGLAGKVAGGLTDCQSDVLLQITRNASSASGSNYVGGLAGHAASFTNCKNNAAVSVTVSGSTSGATYVGGIVGMGDEITGCKNTAPLTVTSGKGNAVYVGGVAGHSKAVTDCKATAPLSVQLNAGVKNYIGGVVGYAGGDVKNAEAQEEALLTVTYSSTNSYACEQYVGGVVAYTTGDISSSTGYAPMTVSLFGNLYTGGVVGYCGGNAELLTAYASLEATVSSPSNITYVGGIAGQISGSATGLTNYATALKATSTGQLYVGGLVAHIKGNATTLTNYAYRLDASSTASNASMYIGGVIGRGEGTLTGAYNTAKLQANANQAYVGGIAGYMAGAVSSAHAVAPLTLTNPLSGNTSHSSYIGGVVGYAAATVTEGKATGASLTVTSGNKLFVGGVVGVGRESITASYAYPAITVSGGYETAAGGVAGEAKQLEACYATGNLTAANGRYTLYAGGLAGKVSGKVTACYATGDIVGRSSSQAYVAGLCAYLGSNAVLSDSYAAYGYLSTDTSASAASDTITVYNGGLVAYNDGSVTNCYAVNHVHAVSHGSSNQHRHHVGGLVGYNNGRVSGSYVMDALDKLARIDLGITFGLVGSGTANQFYAGGLVGYNNKTVENCYSETSVNTTVSGAYTGGFVGYNAATVKYGLAYGEVNSGIAGDSTGGFAGGGSTGYTSCYFNKESARQTTAVGNTAQAGITAATAAALRALSGLSDAWSLLAGSYPTLVFGEAWESRSDGFNKYNMLLAVPNATEQYRFPHEGRVTLRLESNGGPAVDPILGYVGDTVALPTLPAYTASGKTYLFVSWCSDSGLASPLASSRYTLTASVTLYAYYAEVVTLPTPPAPYTYTGDAFSMAEVYTNTAAYTLSGDTEKTDVGNYTLTLTLNKGYCWEDGNTESVTVEWEIKPIAVTLPEAPLYTYTGDAFSMAEVYTNTAAYTLSGDTEKTDVGNYTLTLTLNKGYCWEDGGTESVTVEWKIKLVIVPIPSLSIVQYAGTSRDLAAELGNAYITVTGDTLVTEVDDKVHTLRLTLTDTENYVWSDGSATQKVLEYRIQLYTRVDADGNEDADGDYILFGSYPQTEVTDSTLKSTLRDLVGNLPTSGNAGSWTSYGYYKGTGSSGSQSNSTDYMWYQDISYGGETYRAVYFTSYRPYYTYQSSSTSYSYQDDNGYTTSTVYYFKYEPILWRILTEENGKALLLCELLIDSREYYHSSSSHTVDGSTVYANNYEYSNIRKWLNDSFMETAFTALEQELIQLTTVDNSAASTADSQNNLTQATSYACRDTADYIFLLSEREVTTAAYGFSSSYSNYDPARQKQTTAYAQCQGAYTVSGGSYDGNGNWWLRSPYYYYSNYARAVNHYGYAVNNGGVNLTNYGVCPALWIDLGQS